MAGYYSKHDYLDHDNMSLQRREYLLPNPQAGGLMVHCISASALLMNKMPRYFFNNDRRPFGTVNAICEWPRLGA